MSNHFGIPVKDIEESKKFYQKLGFKVFNSWRKEGQKLEGLWMKNENGCKIELVYHPANKNLKFPKIPEVLHLGIEVENLTEKIKELEKENIKIVIPITKGVTVKCFAFIRDPDGFAIEFSEH